MRSGIDLTAMDRDVRPQDDLFGHVNGGWLERTPIPEDRSRYGEFDALREQSRARVRDLIDEAGAAVEAGAESVDSVRGKVGALYASFLDEARAEALGLEPIRADLEAIEAVESVEALIVLSGLLQRHGVTGLVEPFVSTDARNSARYLVHLQQGGLGLPDESYYHQEQYGPIREAYLGHLRRLHEVAGLGEAEAARAAEVVMAVETRLADAHWDRVATRDAVRSYRLLDRAQLRDLAPAFPWQGWAEAVGFGDRAPEVVARQDTFVEGLSTALGELSLSDLKAWLRRHVLGSFAPYLGEAFVAEHFDFYGRTLSGTPRLEERWKRGVALVDQMMGEAAGQLYVERHFPPAAKARMLELVGNLIEAYRRDITDLAWMSPATREKALAKLAAFTPKIGYPDTWRDYSALVVDPADLVGNVRRGHAFEADRMWGKLGGPVDRGEWFMNPQTVNAYFNPGMNEIVFPAAILQPPFFDPEADDAVNYGGIGSVIGHEIGHGFDDQGSRYDGAGELVDWWTDEDRERFDAQAATLIAQYDGFCPRELPGEHVNGALTVGENIGDLGGVTIAFLAYRIALGGEPAPELDGLTGEQRFFMGWSQVWRSKARLEEARRLLTIDPHSPAEFRANIVRNLHEFHEAFGVRPGDGLWLEPSERVRIW